MPIIWVYNVGYCHSTLFRSIFKRSRSSASINVRGERDDPKRFRNIIQDVFEHDQTINWGRILVAYKFAHNYVATYPDERINVRIILFDIMKKKLKPWIIKSHQHEHSFIASIFVIEL
jgi:hypothetical protein